MAQRDWFDKDYYKILGVSSTATKEEIKKAYRKLAQQHHPDANKDEDSETRFKEISEAHAILSNDEKRKEYDQIREYAEMGGGGYGFNTGRGGATRINVEDLEDLFGGGGAGVGSIFGDVFGFRGNRKGQDIEAEAELSFDDAVHGATLEFANAGKVRIPPGVADGARIRVPGKGAPGPRGGEPGDLFVRVNVKPHPFFSLGKHGNITVSLPVTFPEAALGAKVRVPTLDGDVTVKIPAGTPPGKTLRVRGKGARRANGGNGDLLVRVEVDVPKKLSKRGKQLLEQLADELGSPRDALEEALESLRVKVS